jgi:ABC-2 type transport system permease protein
VRNILTIWRREALGLFLSPLAWILLLVALFLYGVFFVSALGGTGGDVGRALDFALGGSWAFWAFLLFLPPLLTMRLLSEEARSGTLEFLLTAPVTDAAVVLGKFLAATSFMALLWSAVLVYASAIAATGTAPDWSAVLVAYCGAVLSSALFVAIGLLTNCFTSTPLLAAFLAFIASLWWLLLPNIATALIVELKGLLAGFVGGLDAAEHWITRAVSSMDVIGHTQVSFLRGVIDTAEIAFFLIWIAFFLFLTVRMLEVRRWRG